MIIWRSLQQYMHCSSLIKELLWTQQKGEMIPCTFILVECGWTPMEMPFKPMVVGLCMMTRPPNSIGMEKTKMDRHTKLTQKEHNGSVEILTCMSLFFFVLLVIFFRHKGSPWL